MDPPSSIRPSVPETVAFTADRAANVVVTVATAAGCVAKPVSTAAIVRSTPVGVRFPTARILLGAPSTNETNETG